jgi:hypothetical protein
MRPWRFCTFLLFSVRFLCVFFMSSIRFCLFAYVIPDVSGMFLYVSVCYQYVSARFYMSAYISVPFFSFLYVGVFLYTISLRF